MAVLTSHANGLITESKHFAEWFINSHRIGFPAAFSHVHCFYFSLPWPRATCQAPDPRQPPFCFPVTHIPGASLFPSPLRSRLPVSWSPPQFLHHIHTLTYAASPAPPMSLHLYLQLEKPTVRADPIFICGQAPSLLHFLAPCMYL